MIRRSIKEVIACTKPERSKRNCPEFGKHGGNEKAARKVEGPAHVLSRELLSFRFHILKRATGKRQSSPTSS